MQTGLIPPSPLDLHIASSLFPETERLRLRWSSSQRGGGLPFYEDVALGSLGAVADWLGVAATDGAGSGFRFLRAGPSFERQIGHEMTGVSCEALAPNYRVALGDCLRRAAVGLRPASALVRCVQDGLVATCEVLALPLKNRWGGELILVYLRQRPTAHDLVEAIYRSTSDGLLALAAVGDGGAALDFQVVSLNGAAAALFGKPESAVCWQLLSDLVPQWGRDSLRDELARALAHQGPSEFEYTIHRPIEDNVHLRVSVAPVSDLLGIALTDITEMKRREDSVRLLFASNPMPLLVYDRSTLRIRKSNDAMTRHYGRPCDDLLGSRWPDLFADDETAAPATGLASFERQRSRRMIRADGGVVDVEVYANDLVFEGAPCVLATIHDVTEQRRAQARVVYLAHHDDLTGLCNRLLFRTRLDEELALCRRNGEMLALHCIDLDFFKRVNDTFGHGVGDMVLRRVGERIREFVGPAAVVARLGGDEFALVQTGLSSPAEAAALAERLIARLSAVYRVEGHEAVLGASVGISIAPDDGLDPDLLLHNADIALYRSKAEGKGMHHFFESGMDRRLQTRRSLEADLRSALDRGEFELFYQPIVATASLATEGCEALLRWFHPERGAVPPQEFIPIAEEIGMIDAIGDWVLRQACAEATAWPSGFKVAVNLSAAQFRRGALASTVASALAASGLAPSRLELEITESVFLAGSETNLTTLNQLRALGVSISLDDFGTGYSSLAYLSRFPVDKIKIDRSFIRDMADNPNGLAIIRAVVSLGASLGIRTLAEGVETAEQLAQLREERCSEVQGYFLGRPMPAPRLTALLSGKTETLVHAA